MADPGFPRGGGANLQGGGTHLLFGQKFPENCMKMKEFGPRGGHVSLASPLRSANGLLVYGGGGGSLAPWYQVSGSWSFRGGGRGTPSPVLSKVLSQVPLPPRQGSADYASCGHA